MRQKNANFVEYRRVGEGRGAAQTGSARFARTLGMTALAAWLTASVSGVALAQTGTGAPGAPAAPAGTPGGQTSTGAPAAGAPGTATPGANAPGTAAPTAAQTTSGAVSGGGMAAQEGDASASGGNGVSGTSGGSIRRTNAPDDPNFDLARTVSGAVASSAAVIEAQRTYQIDRKRADETAGQARPMLSADGSATRFDQATIVALGGQKFQVIGNHTEALSLNIADRLDLLGIVRAQTSQARLQALADTFTLQTLGNGRVLDAQTIYFTLLRAIHQVSVARAALRNAQAQETIAQRLYEGQIGQKIDYLRATTQVATAQQNLTSALNSRDIARANFNDLVGRPLSAPVFLQDVPGVNVGIDVPTGAAAISAVTGAPAKASAGTPSTTPPVTTPDAASSGPTTVGGPQTSIGFVPYAAPIDAVNAINVDQSIAGAVAVRPEVLQLATQERAANIGVRIARSGLQPTFSISASGNYYPTPSFQYPRQRTVAVTAAVSIPLYDGGITRDRIDEAKLQTQNAQTALDSTKEDVTLQVRQAYLNLATAARQIDAANAALLEAIAARQLAQVRYEGQVGLYLEVTDAQSALVQAENGQVNAVYNYLIARAQFENATGAPVTSNAAIMAPGAPAVGAPNTAVAPGTPVAPGTVSPVPVGKTPTGRSCRE